MASLELTIDGKKISAKSGQTVLDVAKENNIFIPTLCHDPRLKPFGACRVCLVEVEGAKGLLPACATQVAEGMIIRTDTITLHEIRKTVVELILSDHNAECLTCESTGQCQLQDLAYSLGVDIDHFKGEKSQYFVDDFNPLVGRDYRKCIRCGRCARICQEVQGVNVYDFIDRGFESVVSTPFDLPLINTDCEFCGQCVSSCPVGALTDRKRKMKGRVWQTEKTKTICPYCGVGCELVVESRNGQVIGVSARLDAPVNKGNLCLKGRYAYDYVNHPDRLTLPLIRKKGKLVESSWEEAIELVASELKEVKNKYGTQAIAGISSARCTTEENYLFQKLMRAAIGTNNVDHCARLCHSSTVAGLAMAFGSGAMSNSIDDLAQAQVLFVTGSNTTETHPVIGLEIKKAVKDNGAKLIVADPRRIRLADFADLWLAQQPGTDVALINGLMHIILTEGLADKKFIAARTEGFEELEKILPRYTPEAVGKITGVPAEDIKKAARLFAQAERASIVYCVGITQHSNGVNNVLALANLAMLTGNIGREGTGVNPLRGQNNVQGACDVGCLPNVLPGYQKYTENEVVQRFEEAWTCELSCDTGLSLTEMFDAATVGKVKAMYIMGENPALSDPDISHVKEALKSLDFLVVQDIFPTETAEFADVVLPGVSFAEKDGTFTNTERRVQRVRQVIEPLKGAKQDWQIISEISAGLGYPMSYAHPSEIMEEIATVTPAYGGIRYERLENGGLQWPCPAVDHPGTPVLHRETFTRGNGKFHAVEYKPPAEVTDKNYPLILTTGRVLAQYHTRTMTGRSEGIDLVTSNKLVEINPVDAEKYGLKDGDEVLVSTRRGKLKTKAKITDDIIPGIIFIPFHFAHAAVNLLTNTALDPVAKIPELKVAAARISRVNRGS